MTAVGEAGLDEVQGRGERGRRGRSGAQLPALGVPAGAPADNLFYERPMEDSSDA